MNVFRGWPWIRQRRLRSGVGEAAVRAAGPTLRSRSTLTISRDRQIGQVVRDCLSDATLPHIQCRNRWTAAIALERVDIDLTLIDWRLPGRDRLLVAKRALRNGSSDRGSLVLALIPQDDPAALEDALAAGIDDYVPLPLDATALVARVERLERQQGATADLQAALAERVDELQRLRRSRAVHDRLTGLPTREVIVDQLDRMCAASRGVPEQAFAVLFFDIDRFKYINDSLGHFKGNLLLGKIAERVRALCDPSMTAARFGGDEFAVVAESLVDIRAAISVADRLLSTFSIPFDLDGVEVFVTVSIGIAFWNPSYSKPEDLLRDADTAMYRAKAMGRNRYAVFDTSMHDRVVATLQLENDLRRALVRNEFSPYYQPIVDLASGRITGFEALVRWEHPERGLVMPSDFIPVAEDMGAIIQLDRYVAEQGCQQLRTWRGQFRPHKSLNLSVNISSTQFNQPDLVPQIDLILRNTGLYGKSLTIEVTESVLMENAAHAVHMLEQLRSLDIGISIDDFGTGYSSLAYLRRFGIDALKIDHSFVSRMLNDDDSQEIVRTICTLARNLGKQTVAEGVETRSQLEAIRELGVDRVQGNFIAPALPADRATDLLRRTAGSDDHLAKILADRMLGVDGRR
jgi:diguanylate cyclase (GGDEF)-like protein